MLHLWVKKSDTTYIDSSICKGSQVFFKGSYRDTTGFYRDTLINQYGCDSLLILRLTVHKNDTTTLIHTLCGNAPYLFNNINLMSTGIYYDTLKNVTNCDSLLVLNFTRNIIDTTHIYDTICDKTPYVFNGTNLLQSGLYRDTLSNQTSCDSFVFLHLVVHPLDTTRISIHICNGQTYLFNNLSLSQSGTYFKTLKNQKKCDSTIVLTLNVHKPDTTFQNNFFCRGTIYNFYGQNLTQPGTYTKTLSNQYLCDSTIILTLSYRQPYSTTIDTAICYGNLFKTYQTSGVYTESYTSVNGCDSTVTIKLTVSNKPIKDTILYSECNKITLNNAVYTQSQWIQETLKTTHNCDSIFRTHVLNITQIIPVKRKDSTIHFCETMVYKQRVIAQTLELSDTIKITSPPYCDSILQNINFIKVPKPIVTIQATPLDTLVKGQVISLEASKHSNYLWSTGDKIQTIYKQLYTDSIIQLKAWDYMGCEDSTSIAIWVKDRTEIGIPSAFSPNGDGKNDFFEINNLNSDYQILTAQIYNRWGEKVYQSPNINILKWNGTYKNEPVPTGIYTYIVLYKYLPLKIIKELKGTIQVMY
jgi:gliding motility-associated-like protein